MAANLKDAKNEYVYFLYSVEQYNERQKIEKSMSKVFNLGFVIINGQKKFFTELSKSSSNRYPDCKVIAEGVKSKMKYTLPYITG